MGDIVIHLANGKVLHFPEGTPDHVLDGVARMESLPPEYSEKQEKPGVMSEILGGLGQGALSAVNPVPVLQRIGSMLKSSIPGASFPGAEQHGADLVQAAKNISWISSFGMPSGAEELKKGNLGAALSQIMSKSVSQIPITGTQVAGVGQTLGTGDPRQISHMAGALGMGAAGVPLGFSAAKRIVNGINTIKQSTAQARAGMLTSGMGQFNPLKTSAAEAVSESGQSIKIGLTEDIAQHKAASDVAFKAAREAAKHPDNVADVIVGMKEGEPITDPITGEPYAVQQVPVTKQMALPVDVSGIQVYAKQLLDEIDAELFGQKSTSPAYAVLKKVANGPAKVPFGEAIEDVSALGRAGFSKDPLVRGRADGIARSIYTPFKQALETAAQSDVTGQAMDLLNEGRAATKAMYDLRGVARVVVGKKMSKESVKVIRGLTVANDASADMLEALKTQSPQTVKHVAKGYLADVLTQATQKGGFDGEAAFNKWATTGPRTKATLFGHNNGLEKRLNDFFQAAKLAGNTETSGNLFSLEKAATGNYGGVRAVLRNSTGAWEYYLNTQTIEKLLYTKSGADLLTRAMGTPANGAGAKALSNLIYINSILPSSMKKAAPVEP